MQPTVITLALIVLAAVVSSAPAIPNGLNQLFQGSESPTGKSQPQENRQFHETEESSGNGQFIGFGIWNKNGQFQGLGLWAGKDESRGFQPLVSHGQLQGVESLGGNNHFQGAGQPDNHGQAQGFEPSSSNIIGEIGGMHGLLPGVNGASRHPDNLTHEPGFTAAPMPGNGGHQGAVTAGSQQGSRVGQGGQGNQQA